MLECRRRCRKIISGGGVGAIGVRVVVVVPVYHWRQRVVVVVVGVARDVVFRCCGGRGVICADLPPQANLHSWLFGGAALEVVVAVVPVTTRKLGVGCIRRWHKAN